MGGQPRVLTGEQAEIIAYFRATHEQVVPLYELDKKAPFNATTTATENKRFTVEQLARGAKMLRYLWWTAWVSSGQA